MRTILFLLFLVSCGKFSDMLNREDTPTPKTTDKAFSKYVSSFELHFNKKVKVPITFSKLDDRYAGVCYTYSNGYREIEISKTSWDSMNDEQREQVIFHELGHYVLNKGHDDTMLNSGCPKSIMRSVAFSLNEIDDCYVPDFDRYIKELARWKY